MPKLLDVLQFTDNPFANYVAENEPDIESYFVRPPYYGTVTERGNASRSLIIFGSRGAGKSATRLAFHKDAWNAQDSGKKVPLVVTLDDFSRIGQGSIDKVSLGSFVSEVGYLIVEALLVWLASLDEKDRDVYLGGMSSAEESLVITLVNKFYLVRPEHVRTATIVEPLKLLKQAWHKRSGLWINNRWDGIVAVMAGLANVISKRKLDVDADFDKGFSELLKGNPKEWNEALFAKAIFSRFTQFVQTFGFSGVTVLVDKVDETQLTNNSADSTAGLLFPLLVNAQVLEIEGFGWIFFLWDLVKNPTASGGALTARVRTG